MKPDYEQLIVDAVVQRLVTIRKQSGVSQNELAHLTGLSRSGIRHMEAGETNPTLYTLLKIAVALKINLGRLIQVTAKNL